VEYPFKCPQLSKPKASGNKGEKKMTKTKKGVIVSENELSKTEKMLGGELGLDWGRSDSECRLAVDCMKGPWFIAERIKHVL